jgi:hypothetical protein
MRRTTKLIAVFSCIHGLLAMALLLLSFGASSRRFDTGAAETGGERAISRAADVLFLPGTLAWTKWASENLPNAIEGLVFAANSVLWGSVIGLLVVRTTRPPRTG